MQPNEELKNILLFTENNIFQALEVIENQLNTLHTRAQVLMSLAGIVLTITGFSGRFIAGTSLAAQILIIIGLATVLTSAVWIFLRVMEIKWLTNEVTANSPDSLLNAIQRRNRKTKAYTFGGKILCLGLFIYCTAFAIMLLKQ